MDDPRTVRVRWAKTHRIIRSRFPPIDLFEDIADPADWNAIMSAEAKTNPRVAKSVGMLDLVPPDRCVAGVGASWAMAPFTHVSADRPSRFSDGTYGVYYAGDRLEVALFETIHHHQNFMAATGEAPGWTSEFRELVGRLDAELHDVTDVDRFADLYDPVDHAAPQRFGMRIARGQFQRVALPQRSVPRRLGRRDILARHRGHSKTRSALLLLLGWHAGFARQGSRRRKGLFGRRLGRDGSIGGRGATQVPRRPRTLGWIICLDRSRLGRVSRTLAR